MTSKHCEFGKVNDKDRAPDDPELPYRIGLRQTLEMHWPQFPEIHAVITAFTLPLHQWSNEPSGILSHSNTRVVCDGFRRTDANGLVTYYSVCPLHVGDSVQFSLDMHGQPLLPWHPTKTWIGAGILVPLFNNTELSFRNFSVSWCTQCIFHDPIAWAPVNIIIADAETPNPVQSVIITRTPTSIEYHWKFPDAREARYIDLDANQRDLDAKQLERLGESPFGLEPYLPAISFQSSFVGTRVFCSNTHTIQAPVQAPPLDTSVAIGTTTIGAAPTVATAT